MDAEKWREFEDEYAGRIAARIASLYHADQIEVEVIRHGDGHPARIRVGAKTRDGGTGWPYLLNIYLTWRENAFEELLSAPNHFDAYLRTLPGKMQEWMSQGWGVDFSSRTQREPAISIRLDSFDA